MNISLIVVLAILIIVNYYYIELFNRMNQDIKVIKKYIEEKKN
jgi:hypothetical protein